MIKELTKFISNNTDFNINNIGTEIENELESEIDEEEIMMNYMRIIIKTLKEYNIPQKIIDYIIENYKYGLLTFDEKYISDMIENYINSYETNIDGELKNSIKLEGDTVKLNQERMREILEANIVPYEIIDEIIKNLDLKNSTVEKIIDEIMNEINCNKTMFSINRNKFKNNLSNAYKKIEENLWQRNSENLKPKYIKCIKKVLKRYGISNILIKEFENILSQVDLNKFIEEPVNTVNQILEELKGNLSSIEKGKINKKLEGYLNINQNTNMVSTTSIIEVLNANINNLLNGLSFSHDSNKIKQLIIYILVLEIFNKRKKAEDARYQLSDILLKSHDEIHANNDNETFSIFQQHENNDLLTEKQIHYDIDTTKKSKEYNDKDFIKIINESINLDNISNEGWDKIYDTINDIKDYLNNNLNYKGTETPVDNIILRINNILTKQNLVEIIYNDGLLYVNKQYRYNIDPEKGIKLLYEKIKELLNQYKESNGDSELKLIVFCIGIMSKLTEIKKTMKNEKGQIKDKNKKILTSIINLIDEDNTGDNIEGTVSKLKEYLERKQYGNGTKDIINNIYEIVKNSLPNTRYYKNTLHTLQTKNFRQLQKVDHKIQLKLLQDELVKLINNSKAPNLFDEDALKLIIIYTAMIQELENMIKIEKGYRNRVKTAEREPGITLVRQNLLEEEMYIPKQERHIEIIDSEEIVGNKEKIGSEEFISSEEFIDIIRELINEEELRGIEEKTIKKIGASSKIGLIRKSVNALVKKRKLNLFYYRKLLLKKHDIAYIDLKKGIDIIDEKIKNLYSQYMTNKHNKTTTKTMLTGVILKSIIIYTAIKQELENKVKMTELNKINNDANDKIAEEKNPIAERRRRLIASLGEIPGLQKEESKGQKPKDN